jgi:peptidyl-prolyl cis-trans isomerase SurA
VDRFYFWKRYYFMRRYFTLFISIFFTAIVFSQPTQSKKIVADKIAAVVGDRIIMLSDIKNSIADYVRQGAEVPDDAQCMIMEQALISKVLMLQAEKDSLPITDEEVEADLDLRIRQFINAYGTQQAVEEIAGKSIYQIKDDARESIREKKLAEAMQHKIVENVKITPTEVKAFFDKIPKDSLPFFESELEVGHIDVYPKASRDLEKYTIDELNRYKQQAEAKTSSFEQLARLHSQDPTKDKEFQLNRMDKNFDPAFVSAAFRLKDGQISSVVKSKFGYHIIQMVQRNGDEAIVRHILQIPPITDDETRAAVSKLDSVRANLIAGTIGFNEAALKYSEDESSKFSSAFFTGRSGTTYVTIDELDKDVVTQLGKLKIGEYSQPVSFTDERQAMKKGVRIIYLKSRSQPHRMNLHDDYNKISDLALEQKKAMAMDKWIQAHLSTYYIMVADDIVSDCPGLQKYVQKKSF